MKRVLFAKDLQRGHRSTHMSSDRFKQLSYRRVYRQQIKDGRKEPSGSKNYQTQQSTNHEAQAHNHQELPTSRGDDSNFRSLLLNMLVKDLHPLNTVEGAGFQCLFSDLQLNASYVQAELQSLYMHKRMEVQCAVNKARNLVLSAELWSSKDASYLTVTCHLINDHWKLKSYVLNTAHLLTEHTAENAVQKLLRISDEWNITEKIQIVVTNVDGIKKVQIKGCKWLYIPCFANTLEKVFREAIDECDWIHLLRKCQNIVAFFHQNIKASQKFCADRKLQQNELSQSTGLNWLPTLHMLKSILKQWPAIFKVFVDYRVENLCLNENERKIINDIILALNILMEVTKEIGSQGYSPISNIIPLVQKLQENLRNLGMMGNRIAEKLSEKCDHHISNIKKHKWFRVSTALDPRYKTSVLWDSGIEDVKTDIIKSIDYKPAEHSSSYDTENELVLQRYWKITEFSDNPLEFWRTNNEFKQLTTAARKFLTVVSTAVPVERVHQLKEAQIVNRRNCLEPENVNMILFLNSNSF